LQENNNPTKIVSSSTKIVFVFFSPLPDYLLLELKLVSPTPLHSQHITIEKNDMLAVCQSIIPVITVTAEMDCPAIKCTA
jgi:hypothetical protein